MAANNTILKFPHNLEENNNFSFISFSAYNKASEKSPDKVAASNGTSKPAKAEAQTAFDNPHTAYLFVPGTLTDNTSITYEEVGMGLAKQIADVLHSVGNGDLSEALSDIVKGGGRAGDTIGQNLAGAAEALTGVKVKSVIEQRYQKVLNPQLAVLFKGIGVREFSFSFDMFPKNEKESQEIERIIRMFKYYSFPYIDGNFMHYPSYFEIEAKTGAKDSSGNRKVLMKFHRAAITGVNVERNPTGVWSTFANGDPVNTKLTLTVKETKQTMRDDINLDITKDSF